MELRISEYGDLALRAACEGAGGMGCRHADLGVL